MSEMRNGRFGEGRGGHSGGVLIGGMSEFMDISITDENWIYFCIFLLWIDW